MLGKQCGVWTRRYRPLALVMTMALSVPWAALTAPSVARADNLQNTVPSSASGKVLPYTVGPTPVTVDYVLVGNASNQDITGCNANSGNRTLVSITVPSGVTATPSQLSFSDCGVPKSVDFSATSTAVGDTSITVSISGGRTGSLYKNETDFILRVTAPQDNQAPTISVSGVPKNAQGQEIWSTTAPVSITISATDDVELASIGYTLDSATTPTTVTVNAGSKSGSANVSVSGDGQHTLNYTATDKAGNKSSGSTFILIDTTKPTIQGSRTPAANGFGWNNTDVAVSFVCGDTAPPGGSGLVTCVGNTTLTGETTADGQSFLGTATDGADNIQTATVGPIKIDRTVPTLSGQAVNADGTPRSANGALWYNSDVTVRWTGQDGLSGIDPATVPADTIISKEGTNNSAGPVTVKDKAGNTSAPASVTGIKIDKTAPTVSGRVVNPDGTPRNPNAAGWYNSGVIVRFTCVDTPTPAPLGDGTSSGCSSATNDILLNSDGANHSVSCGTLAQGCPLTDNAGNTASAPLPVSGIKIDSQAPSTQANVACAGNNGWCNGNNGNGTGQQVATVSLTATDQSGLSGVQQILYRVGTTGDFRGTNGSTANATVPLNGAGEATVQFYAMDNAGNSESIRSVTLKYDTIAPTVSGALIPAANSLDWNNSDVTVHFTAVDNDGGSGVAPGTVTADVAVSTETAGQTVDGQAYDIAGNLGKTSATVRVDKTAPIIRATVEATAPPINGWYSGPVTVKFTCGDALSGILICPDPVNLSANGESLPVSGTATDKAGNVASLPAPVVVKIDTEKPAVTVGGVASGGIYTLGQVPTASCSAQDGVSGVDGQCSVVVSGGLANGVGTFTYTVTAKDKAGNTSTQSGTYKVIYKWTGFLQPINDTAHQTGTLTSVFKAGSTVPVKLQLKRVDGSVVQANTDPQWLSPTRLTATAAAIDETVYTDPPSGGYRWDSTSQQYNLNWGTAKNQVGYYWRIYARLDDGQVYYVDIGLR
jgi:hypothetical protein